MTTTVDACIIAALETKLQQAETLIDRYETTLRQISELARLGHPATFLAAHADQVLHMTP